MANKMFEYLKRTFSWMEVEDRLNELGVEGWELSGFHVNTGPTEFVCIFKREVPETRANTGPR